MAARGTETRAQVAHDGFDHRYRQVLDDRYHVMAKCKDKLKKAFIAHSLYCGGIIVYAILALSSETAFSRFDPSTMLLFCLVTLLVSPFLPVLAMQQRNPGSGKAKAMIYLYLVAGNLMGLLELGLVAYHLRTPYQRMPGYHKNAWIGAVALHGYAAAVNIFGVYYTALYVQASGKQKRKA